MDKRLTCVNFSADILGHPESPNIISSNDSQIIFGEEFIVEDERGAYVYGYNDTDKYPGFVERVNLAMHVPTETHVIVSLSTHLYPEPDFKSRPEDIAPFMGRISCKDSSHQEFIQTHDGFWIYKKHVQKIDAIPDKKDIVSIAKQFFGAPYLFGGRTILGIDCTGLVQICMMAAGHDCPPRDSKDQEGAFGKKITKNNVKRNDIVYFKGHVGIMIDEENILNATSRYMTTLIEPLDDLEEIYNGITHIARI